MSAAGTPPKNQGRITPWVVAGAASAPRSILADRRGRPLRLRVTGGQRHDSTQARALWKDGHAAALPDGRPGL